MLVSAQKEPILKSIIKICNKIHKNVIRIQSFNSIYDKISTIIDFIKISIFIFKKTKFYIKFSTALKFNAFNNLK